jgi:hypothetical protein
MIRMHSRIYFQSLLAWLTLAFITILFAIFREAVFIPVTRLSDTMARALLLPVGIGYTIAIAYVFLKITKVLYTFSVTIKIGVIWLLLTMAFEFTFGTLVMGHSLSALLADYNILAGRTWPIFLLGVFLAPPIAARLFNKKG